MTESSYKVIEIVGTSPESWERATAVAVERAGKSLRDLRIAEVIKQDVQIENGKVAAYRVRLNISFPVRRRINFCRSPVLRVWHCASELSSRCGAGLRPATNLCVLVPFI